MAELFTGHTEVIREKLAEGFSDAQATAYATTLGLISPYALEKIEVEALRLPTLFRRDIGDPNWYKTKRATCVPLKRITWKQPYFLVTAAEVWLPTTTALSKDLATMVREIGIYSGLAPLAQFQPNRLGFNYMHGTPEDPAYINDHTDPIEESGVVMAVNLGPTTDSQEVGAVNLILSKDTCDELAIPQPLHKVSSETRRIGLTIANLGIKSVFERISGS